MQFKFEKNRLFSNSYWSLFGLWNLRIFRTKLAVIQHSKSICLHYEKLEKSLTPVHNEPLIGIAEKLIRRAAIVVIAQYQINNITFFNIVYRGFKQ